MSDEKENIYPFTDHPVVQALRARAPQLGRDGWYSEVSDGTGYSESAIKGWYYGKTRPEPEAEEALTRYFGIQFADEVSMSRYGWHTTANGQQAKANSTKIADHARAILELADGKVTALPVKGRVS